MVEKKFSHEWELHGMTLSPPLKRTILRCCVEVLHSAIRADGCNNVRRLGGTRSERDREAAQRWQMAGYLKGYGSSPKVVWGAL
jgi:hypothetical protein